MKLNTIEGKIIDEWALQIFSPFEQNVKHKMAKLVDEYVCNLSSPLKSIENVPVGVSGKVRFTEKFNHSWTLAIMVSNPQCLLSLFAHSKSKLREKLIVAYDFTV